MEVLLEREQLPSDDHTLHFRRSFGYRVLSKNTNELINPRQP